MGKRWFAQFAYPELLEFVAAVQSGVDHTRHSLHCAYPSLWRNWKLKQSVDELDQRHHLAVDLQGLQELELHDHRDVNHGGPSSTTTVSTIGSWICGAGVSTSDQAWVAPARLSSTSRRLSREVRSHLLLFLLPLGLQRLGCEEGESGGVDGPSRRPSREGREAFY